MREPLITERLVLRPWRAEDAVAALAVYGDKEIAHWLTPAMSAVPGEEAMRSLLADWAAEEHELIPPAGRWAVTRKEDDEVVGGLSVYALPPYKEDLAMAWQLARAHQGNGYAVEAARALAGWAFAQGADELFAVVRPSNVRGAAMARRLGMEWTGETEKYYDLRLQVYRMRPSATTA